MALIQRSLLYKPSYQVRSYYYKFKRAKVPPLQEPKESPYIVGPYLKPNYYPTQYITEPIKERFNDDFDDFIYQPTKVETDEERTVRLLLIKDVEGLGIAGQTVDVKGASKLIAMKQAEYSTDFAHQWYKFGPKTGQSASSALSPRTARLLRTQTFELPVSQEICIQPWHIALALRLAGCICPITSIVAVEQGASEVKATIVINNHERVDARFKYKSYVE